MAEFLREYRRLVRTPRLWLAAIALLLVIGELSCNIVEAAIGRYLVWHNPGREKIGRSWQEEQNRLLANTNLERLTQVRREQLSLIAGLSKFEELVNFTAANARTELPPEQFGLIYRELPALFRPLLVPTGSMVSFNRERNVTQVTVNRYPDRLDLFLLDANHEVLFQSSLPADHIEMIVNHGKERQMDLRQVARFAGRVLRAADFFEVLDRKFYDERAEMIRELPVLTDPSTHIARVGFANRSTAGFVETAFALDDGRALIYYLPEEWTTDFIARAGEHANQNPF
ncbi:MAG: hypothetical protein ONB48_04065 [candidate division KSB1 bacterium]|nr:hypothetical protein [candidate division KSB1 bacterium]MDZ7274514.1 hypothetical protein [candidate division KSB1 bacterium]MDZ7284825.1 hypothetical protein [candidate division KSB1 bacterium]MDZ7297755.1 hypothetical protein [candidate division KSB1 bacterium]MDZ7308686.1 hypothetical protein [candidate division KSB1 bacterium]